MLNYGRHWIDEDDIAAVAEVLRTDFLTQGPTVAAFERVIADYVGSKYAVAVCNGTAALHIAVGAARRAAGSLVGDDAEGITSPITFVASSNCLIYNGLKPVFADIDGANYSLDPVAVRRHVGEKTQFLIPVHFAGQVCDMEGMAAIKDEREGRIFIIEDASHAIGSRYENGERVGSCCYGDMTTFSFHPVKTIATGEGGVVTTNDEALYKQLLLLRNHGITKEPELMVNRDPEFTGPWYYEMQALGFNYRMTDMQAALGISQMKKVESFVHRRREIVAAYNRAFAGISWLTIPYEKPGLYSAFHLYVLQIDFAGIKRTRAEVMAQLKKYGVGTQVLYIPVHLQPYYREHYNYHAGDFPVAETYYKHCLSIPLYPKMTDADIKTVIKAIHSLN